MKSISTIISFFFLIFLLQLAAAASPAVGPLDQRNRPPAISDAQRHPVNARIKTRSNPRKQHHSHLGQSFSYDSLPDNISCSVDHESPLLKDVSSAIGALNDGDGHQLRCNYDNTSGDGENQFCTTLILRESAVIAVCTILIKRIDCKKIAEIAMAVSDKCEEECAGERRVAGMVSMAWGNIFVLNSTTELRVE